MSSPKSADAYRTISEVAEMIGVKPHVLRFWEKKFPQIKPLKRESGRRYYRPEDVKVIQKIKQLLYQEGYTVRGVQKLFKQKGVRVFQLRDESLEFETMAADDTDRANQPHHQSPSSVALSEDMHKRIHMLYHNIHQYLEKTPSI